MRCRRPLFAVLLAVVLVLPSAVRAAPELKHLFPPGGQRGQTVEVTASGKFPAWPVRAWVDRPGVEVTALEKEGTLSIRIADDARPGLYFVRLYDDSGASSPRPFVVGTTAETVEAEPNNTLDAAQRVAPSDAESVAVVVNGQLPGGGDVDLFAVAAKAGQTLIADLDAEALLGSPVDAVMQIVSADGFVQAQNHDHQRLDPRIVFEVPHDGEWLVRVFGFPAAPNSSIAFAGGDNYLYRLTLATGPYVDYTWPLAVSRDSAAPAEVKLHGWNLPPDLTQLAVPATDEPEAYLLEPRLARAFALPVVGHASLVEDAADDADAPQGVVLPSTITGRIDQPGDRDVYSLAVEKGAIVRARIESRGLGYDLDPVLEVTDAEGKQLARADDVGDSRDAEVAYTAAADGELRLVVADLHRDGGERFVYRLTIERAAPEFRLAIGQHELTMEAGGTVDLPVTVERLNGHAESIAISVEGLPEGMSATEATSSSGDDSAKQVTLKITAAVEAAPGSAPMRVVGRVGDRATAVATFAAPDHTARLADLFLTVKKPGSK